jgi:hypothetical protein
MTLLASLERGLAELERCFDDALDAALPNPVALIFSDLPLAYQGKRDLVFAMDLLNEGENECALIAAFAGDRLRDDPGAGIAHLEREAWYYLRTSIDPTWQFDDGEPSLPAALAYLAIVLREHPPAAERAVLLGRLRAEANAETPDIERAFMRS